MFSTSLSYKSSVISVKLKNFQVNFPRNLFNTIHHTRIVNATMNN